MNEARRFDKLPAGSVPAISGLEDLAWLVELPEQELVSALRRDGALCDQAFRQSHDKRYQPSTFIEESAGQFRVGWYDHGYNAVRAFTDRELAVADYLLFSFGKGRLGASS